MIVQLIRVKIKGGVLLKNCISNSHDLPMEQAFLQSSSLEFSVNVMCDKLSERRNKNESV
jgi:hypothetical protein